MIATGAVLAASGLVFAQDKSHVGHAHGRGDDGVVPTMPGQDAFGAIQEIVRILEADPDTDWRRSTWLPWGAPIPARPLGALLGERRDRHHLAVITLTAQPAEEGALQ